MRLPTLSPVIVPTIVGRRGIAASAASTAAVVVMATIALPACSPALNWRKVQPEGAQLELMFPCKPEREERAQPGPAGQPVTLRTLSCKAQGGQYSLTWTDLGDAGATSTAMRRMHEGLARRLAPGASAPLGVRGIASDPEAFQQVFEHRPGQPAQQVRQAVFSRGGRLYQLLLQGERADAAAWDVFVGSVQLPPT